MNEAVVNNMSIINGLNKVDGFDPSAFLRRLTGENGEEQFYLDGYPHSDFVVCRGGLALLAASL